ncbi:hypothetical protein MWMV2_MWMV2_01079 [Acinetobacter oleivorans]|uniref:hypothetical protein n=1 Tax=Acinetobacter seifertii TaxID=1530123 RepID=UPI0021F03A0C|nr:hypothetical protein MWMV5_MWMV5_00047 [Acinetobacter oleivorans]CAI3100071.1 hypothetical protein MWMV13_MWMV13_00047 [Acinetobacter oleivorans]CAI3118431.1 hypothetical protein MWMV3_MWMV3_01079 [Acinetobacter oleivorans]CAI3118471.1 hypothetical protein MWMV12_MWMV12_01079 [Acinetobacter oleivorans]CAI3118524.1 hypothetical protein MWMV19_MWMV19_01079 [Acinetobacter oleivorans]
MTETSEEKKKRKLIRELREHQWLYQYSVYPRLLGENRAVDKSRAEGIILLGIDDFRNRLRKRTANIGIFFEIRKMNVGLIKGFETQYKRKNFAQIYITFYTSEEIEVTLLNEIVETAYCDEVNVRSRKVTEEKMLKTIATIRRQGVYNFSSYYEIKGNKFNRYSCIHRSSFIKKEEVL